MSFDNVQQWLDHVESAGASQGDSRDDDRPKHIKMPTPPSTWLDPFSRATKRKHESLISVIETPKRPRHGARDSETNSATSCSILPLRDDLTLSLCASTTSQSELHRRSSSPARHKRLLEYATPKVRYLYEWDAPEDSAAQDLRDFLSDSPTDWEPDPNKIQEVLAGSRKCVVQQRSEISWVTEVTRPILQAAIGDLPLESWGVQTESVSAEYQPRYPARDRCNRKIDWVVGFPKERWETLYARISAKFHGAFINHVDHPHTGAQVLGCGYEIQPPNGNLVGAQVQLGVWMAGFFAWAFKHRSGTQSLPQMVEFIPVGDSWGFYIIYAVQEGTDDRGLPKLGEVRVWGPLCELAGRTSNERTCSTLAKTLRCVMEYVCGRYIEQLQLSVYT